MSRARGRSSNAAVTPFRSRWTKRWTLSEEPGADLVALDDALTALAAFDERKSKVVELRFFGGLTVEETAEVLKVSVMTVMRDWALAKVWLLRELEKK